MTMNLTNRHAIWLNGNTGKEIGSKPTQKETKMENLNLTNPDSINMDRGVKPVRRGNECACGCAHATATEKARYLPGHDARHVAVLLSAVERGTMTAEEAVGRLESIKLADKLTNAIKRSEIRTQMKAAGATNRAVQKMVSYVGTDTTDTKDIDPVKIGRWFYPARQDSLGLVYRNLKTDGSGLWTAV